MKAGLGQACSYQYDASKTAAKSLISGILIPRLYKSVF